jgi:hypothetical protein
MRFCVEVPLSNFPHLFSSLLHKSFPSAFQSPNSHHNSNKTGKGSPPTLFSPGQNLYPRSSAGKWSHKSKKFNTWHNLNDLNQDLRAPRPPRPRYRLTASKLTRTPTPTGTMTPCPRPRWTATTWTTNEWLKVSWMFFFPSPDAFNLDN